MPLIALLFLLHLVSIDEVLVKVDNLPLEEVKKLLDNGIEVWEYNSEFALIVCTPKRASDIFKAEIIDKNPRANQYFIVTPLEPVDYRDYLNFIDIVWTNGKIAIVKDKGIRPYGIKIRAEIKKVRNKPIIINLNKPNIPFLARQDTLIEEMIANIDSAMVYNYTKRLQDFRSRNNFNDSIISAAAYVFNEFTQSGLDFVYYSESGNDPWGSPFIADNIVGIKYGETDSALIICGHLDATAGNPYTNEEFAPGADDNASGSAGVLSAAKVMAPYEFHRELRFICFVGEELGLYGSAKYADSCANTNSSIVGVYNMDMICHRDQGSVEDLDADDNLHSPSGFLSDTLIHFGDIYMPALPIIERHLTGGSSDHASFQNAGYPAILTIDDAEIGANPYIHTTGDTIGPSANDFTLMKNSVKAVVATVAELAGILHVGIKEEGRARKESFTMPSIVSGPFEIRLQLSQKEMIEILLYDINGKLISTLLKGSLGESMNLRCNLSKELADGIYFLVLRDPFNRVKGIKKFILVR